MPYLEGESLGAIGKKRLGRTRFPQNGDIGGSMAASELSEEPQVIFSFWEIISCFFSVDCGVEDWSKLSDCGVGTKKRGGGIVKEAENGGASYTTLEEKEPCNTLTSAKVIFLFWDVVVYLTHVVVVQ